MLTSSVQPQTILISVAYFYFLYVPTLRLKGVLIREEDPQRAHEAYVNMLARLILKWAHYLKPTSMQINNLTRLIVTSDAFSLTTTHSHSPGSFALETRIGVMRQSRERRTVAAILQRLAGHQLFGV